MRSIRMLAVSGRMIRGSGNSPEALQRIFEPLYTTRRGGSGLGLVIVREVVTRHGGRIGCTSEPGQGARFVLEFPLLPGALGSEERSVCPGTVVVLDPEGEIARLTGLMLEQGGYRVRSAGALSEVEQEKADAVVVCGSLLNAEGVKGLEAWLRKNEGAALVVTSTGPEPALTAACVERLRGVVSKPYSAEMLLKAVAKKGGAGKLG